MKTTKDWVEGLHKRADLLFSLVTAIEARLAAIEAGICLVPLSVNDPRSQPPNYNIPNVQLLIRSAFPKSTVHSPHTQSRPIIPSTSTLTSTSVSQPIQSFQPESCVLDDTLQSTPVTPNRRLEPLSSISPIISNLPKETACNLKKYQQKASSRKKYMRNVWRRFLVQMNLLRVTSLATRAKTSLMNTRLDSSNVSIDKST